MNYTTASTPGNPETPSEDWLAVTSDLVVVLDGATIRTETGCKHGAVWYVRELGSAILRWATSTDPKYPLRQVLKYAIEDVNARHFDCDLLHPGTPSAAVGIVHLDEDCLRYLVLGDVSVALETDSSSPGIIAVSDPRVSLTAARERTEVDKWPIGSAEKDAALIPMKHAELAARNVEDGYWIAASDPAAAEHAITGEIPLGHVRRFAVLTDGAARFVDPFRLGDWTSMLDVLDGCGPQRLIDLVRSVEGHDPFGLAYPRNKRHDDASIVYAKLDEAPVKPELFSAEERQLVAAQFLARVNAPEVTGA